MITTKERTSYFFRFLVSLLSMETILHLMYVVAIKDTKAWDGDTPFELTMIGFWNLSIVWLKVCTIMMSVMPLTTMSCSSLFHGDSFDYGPCSTTSIRQKTWLGVCSTIIQRSDFGEAGTGATTYGYCGTFVPGTDITRARLISHR